VTPLKSLQFSSILSRIQVAKTRFCCIFHPLKVKSNKLTMTDAWNLAAEQQELTETVQRLVNSQNVISRDFPEFTQFQSDTVGEVNLGGDIKPADGDAEQEK
jgi:hypothetical protein